MHTNFDDFDFRNFLKISSVLIEIRQGVKTL